MGGVDLFDQKISYYRTQIKSKKWTLRMISYGFDAAVTNAFITYERDCKLLGLSKKETKTLLQFRLELINSLILPEEVATSAKKRGRPPKSMVVEPEPEPEPIVKKLIFEVQPAKVLRFDKVGHWPIVDTKKEATRCKLCTKQRTHLYCDKCKVHLCLKSDRNCFIKYHTESD